MRPLIVAVALALVAGEARADGPAAWAVQWDATWGIDLSFAEVVDIGAGEVAIYGGRKTRVLNVATGKSVREMTLPGEDDPHRAAWVGRWLVRETEDRSGDLLEVWDPRQGKLVRQIGRELKEWAVRGDRLVLSTERKIEVWLLADSVKALWDAPAQVKVEQKQGPFTTSFDLALIDLHLTEEAVYGGYDERFSDYVPIVRYPWKKGAGTGAGVSIGPPKPAFDPFVWRTAGQGVLVMHNTNQGKTPYRFKGWDCEKRTVLYDVTVEALNGFHPNTTENLGGAAVTWYDSAPYMPFIEDSGQAVPERRKAQVFDLRTGQVAHEMSVWRAAAYVATDSVAWWIEEGGGSWAVHSIAPDGTVKAGASLQVADAPSGHVRSDGRVLYGVRDRDGGQEVVLLDPRSDRLQVLLRRPNEDGGKAIYLWPKCTLADGTVVVVECRDDVPAVIHGIRPDAR